MKNVDRITLTMPKEIIDWLDEKAKKKFMSRSGYVKFMILEQKQNEEKTRKE